MSKGGVIVLIIAALVFAGLGFVVGNVVSGMAELPGSATDPAVTEGYVDKAIAIRTEQLQSQIDELRGLIDGGGGAVIADPNSQPVNPPDGQTTSGKVKVTADSVNIRSSASTGAEIVGTANSGTELEYLASVNASDGVWYNVRLSSGTEGYVASWLCGNPY